jgi:hypothetical protein
MLHEILLLTEQAAQQLALTELLKAHNPRLTFRYALTADDLSAIDPASLRHSRLLAFTTGSAMAPIMSIPGRRTIPAGRRRTSRITMALECSAPRRTG